MRLAPLPLGPGKHCETTDHTPDIVSMTVQCHHHNTALNMWHMELCQLVYDSSDVSSVLNSVSYSVYCCDPCFSHVMVVLVWFWFLVSYFLSVISFLLAHFSASYFL